MITLTTEQAQQIEEALEDIVRVFEFETGTPVEALATIRAARAQEFTAEQQNRFATAFDEAFAKFEWLTKFDYHKHHMTPLYATPQPVMQEPVYEALQIASVALQDIACSSQTENLYWWQLRARKAQKQIAERLINAAPVSAKREWVDLTDDEIYHALAEVRFVRDNLLDGCRAVIAADREKNK